MIRAAILCLCLASCAGAATLPEDFDPTFTF